MAGRTGGGLKRRISTATSPAGVDTEAGREACRNWAFRRSTQTALDRSSDLGWAEIRHPFHPLRGQRFEVLKKRRIAGVDTLILRERECGSFSIAREWTDWADPLYDVTPGRFDAEALFELVTLLEHIAQREEKC